MNTKRLSIGEMSRINHTSINALRLYDKLGILRPAYVDPNTNYRYYDINQNSRLNMINYMKELGMSLQDIKDTLDQENMTLIEAILLKKQQKNLEEMQELKMKQSAINRTIYSIERHRKSPKPGMITVEYIDSRRIYSMYTPTNFYESGSEGYEMVLNDLKEQLLKHHLPQVYFCNVGTFMKREDFLKDHYESHEIFIFVDDYFPLMNEVKTLDSGMYACIYLDHFDDEIEYGIRLRKYCKDHHYEVIGDYICEVLYELDIFESDKREMFFRLQVPIQFK